MEKYPEKKKFYPERRLHENALLEIVVDVFIAAIILFLMIKIVFL